MRGHSDRIHDEVVGILNDLAKLIPPLVPEGYQWMLAIDPGKEELKFWVGNIDNERFGMLVLARVRRAAADNPAWWEQFKKEVDK